MKRLTDEQVENYINQVEGYSLLKRYYKDNWHWVTLKCPQGHIYDTLFNNWKKGVRCNECSGNKKKDWNKIIQEFKNEKYEVLSDEYKGVNGDIEYICPNGNYGKTTYKRWQKGQRCYCLQCKPKGMGYHNRYTPFKLYQLVESNGYELLNWYFNKQAIVLKLLCPEGHHIEMFISNFIRGHRCKLCAWEKSKKYDSGELKDWNWYNAVCRSITLINYRKYYKDINPKKLPIGKYEYHRDHIYSVSHGFNNNVPPYLIGSPVNLHIMWWKDNQSKNSDCWISLNELVEKHLIFINEGIINGSQDTL